MKPLFENIKNLKSTFMAALLYGVKIAGIKAVLFLVAFIVFYFSDYHLEKRDYIGRQTFSPKKSTMFNLTQMPDDILITLVRAKSFTCSREAPLELTLLVVNHSDSPISSSKNHRSGHGKEVNLAYKIYDENTNKLVFESDRFYLKRTLLPKSIVGNPDSEVLNLKVNCESLIPGNYHLHFQAVQEGIGWQSDFSNKTRWIRKGITVI